MYPKGTRFLGIMEQNNNDEDRPTIRTVKVEMPIYEKLAEIAKVGNKDLKSFVNEELMIRIKKYEVQEKLLSSMTLIGSEDSSLFIRDHKEQKLAEVRVEQEEDKIVLYCATDGTKDRCIHIIFVEGLLSTMSIFLNNVTIA